MAIVAEIQPSAATAGLPVAQGGNLEGKEVRLGPVASATWAAITTATSNGSVNAMHDSFQPLGGLVPMALMMLNVDFSGIGAGFLNMLMYVIVAVFLAGLMVGRTPEYLGKKIEAREVKLAMIVVLIHPLLITLRHGPVRGDRLGQDDRGQPRPARLQRDPLRVHLGRGQQRLGLRGAGRQQPRRGTSPPASSSCSAGSPRWCCRSRSPASSPRRNACPQTSGTLLTNDLTFAAMLLGTVLLVGALSFMPAVVLGPIADHLVDGRARPMSRSNEPDTESSTKIHRDRIRKNLAMTLLTPTRLPDRAQTDVQALKLQRRQTRRLKLFEPALVQMATIRSFVMLDPRNMARNPVMFLVEVGWVLTTLVTIESIVDRRGHRADHLPGGAGDLAALDGALRQLRRGPGRGARQGPGAEPAGHASGHDRLSARAVRRDDRGLLDRAQDRATAWSSRPVRSSRPTARSSRAWPRSTSRRSPARAHR